MTVERILKSVEDRVGSTPLVELTALERVLGLKARVLAKVEGANPAGSAKDRVALHMLRRAEAEGRLAPGGTVIEPTSGNTGIALAALCAARGYRAVIVMPDSMSAERRLLMEAYGAQVVFTPGSEGMSGAIRRAEELRAAIPGSIIAGQFDNPANPEAHYLTTGPEIWRDTAGNVDIFVAGVGTGGTVTGTGRYLKEQNPALTVVAVEPAESPLLSEGWAAPHGIQGIGANFVPGVLDRSVYDRVMTVTAERARDTARLLGREEGLLAGISSGAALWAALELAGQPEHRGKTVVVLLPDTGERYLSTGLFGI